MLSPPLARKEASRAHWAAQWMGFVFEVPCSEMPGLPLCARFEPYEQNTQQQRKYNGAQASDAPCLSLDSSHLTLVTEPRTSPD